MAVKTLHFSTYDNKRWGGPKRYIRVYIHDTREELRNAARKYRRRTWQDWDKTMACFHPTPRREKMVGKKWVNLTNKHFAGVIRFTKDDINADIVTHEIVHVAAAIYRMDVRKNCNLGPDCFEAEENFAYIVGDLTGSLSIVLHETNSWSKEVVQ